MAAAFKKTTVKKIPIVGDNTTRDTVYWRNLKFPTTIKEYGAVTNIHFSPVDPYNFAVTNSSRVQLYTKDPIELDRTISRFRETAYSATYRQDGKLLVAGGEDPVVKLFDLEHKSMLRLFSGHKQPVHVTKFLSSNFHIVSCADDMTCRVWDLTCEKELVQYKEHKDYIRAGTVSKASKDIFLSASYDFTAKVFDIRTASSVLSVNHGAPIESIVMFPSGGVFITAGAESVKIWDALAGGRLLHQFSNHHKTVTSLCFSSNYQRLLSGSLDRHVKVYDVSTYQLVHTLDYPGQILSVAVAPDDSCIAVGMSDGMLSVQQRKPDLDTSRVSKKKASYKYAVSGQQYKATKYDDTVEHHRKERLDKYDRFLKRFEYSKALDAALEVRGKTPEITISVMQELIRRDGLQRSLAGRDFKSISIIVKFIQRNMCNDQFQSVLIDVSSILLDLYSDKFGEDSLLDQRFAQLYDTICRETNYMKNLFQLQGIMDTIFSAASQPDNPSVVELMRVKKSSTLKTD